MTVYAKWTPKTYQITYNLPADVSWSYADNNDNMFMSVQLQNDTPYYIMDDVPVQEDETADVIADYSGNPSNIYLQVGQLEVVTHYINRMTILFQTNIQY